MTAADLLAAEEARAMSGRPRFRVVAASIKGGTCPRCLAVRGVKCKGSTHPERVWAQRARGRAAVLPTRGVDWNALAAFADALRTFKAPILGAVIWPDLRGERVEWRAPDDAGDSHVSDEALAAAIARGLVRLAISGGSVPVWVVTEAGVVFAEEFARTVDAITEPKPAADRAAVNAEELAAAFAERSKAT